MEAFKLYFNLINPDIVVLQKSKSKSADRRVNILNVPKILESVFACVYFHYDKVQKPESEERIAERKKLRKQRSNGIAKKRKTISPELLKRYFGYSGTSDVYKTLNKARTAEEHKDQVNEIGNRLTGLIEMIKSSPTSDAKNK